MSHSSGGGQASPASGSCSYGQFMADRGPRYDNDIRKRKTKRKKKKEDK